MKIENIIVGELETNCYVLEIDNKVLVIDPGYEPEKIDKFIGNREICGIIITHHHFDHDSGVSYFTNKYNVEVYDYYNLIEGNNTIDSFNFFVIYTPGHKEDLITIYFKNIETMFCGDFIFKDSIGRCDLPGGNELDMIKSINKIKKYNRNIVIYPGHGDKTNLEYEINNNYYFKNI